jgi:hypothetical protein
MSLFRKRRSAAARPAPPVSSRTGQVHPPEIALSAEQTSLLKEPVDPRVEKILRKIYSDRAAAERALNSKRITGFANGNFGDRHVIQDENGFWRIVPGPPPEHSVGPLGAL